MKIGAWRLTDESVDTSARRPINILTLGGMPRKQAPPHCRKD